MIFGGLLLYFYKMENRKRLIHYIHIYMVLYFKSRYVSCALGCPYEGSITPQKVTEVRYAFGFLVHGKTIYVIFKRSLFPSLFSASAQQRLKGTMEWESCDCLTNSFILTLRTYILPITVQS